MITGLRNGNLDWLFFGRVHIWPLTKNSESRVIVYGKLLFQIFISLFRTRESFKAYSGGLLFVDNSRHFDQANIIVPFLNNIFYHNNTSGRFSNGTSINLVNNIYFNYKKLIKYLPQFLKEEFRKKSKIFQADLSLSLYGILLYENYLDFFRHNDIKYVVIFTDHTYKNRALMYAAKQVGIPTIYIPHASVSENFPPLEMEIAFMEGENMKEKYLRINEKYRSRLDTNLIYSGNVKLNNARGNMQRKEKKFSLGLAFNPLDSVERIENIVKDMLSSSYLNNYTIIVRPHPSLDYKLKELNARVFLSNSKNQTSLEYLKSIDFLITGDSNLALEAVLMETPCFIFPLATVFHDNYGFVSNGVCPFIKDLDEIEPYIKKNFKDYSFNNKILESYDYSFSRSINSAEIIVKTLNQLVN